MATNGSRIALRRRGVRQLVGDLSGQSSTLVRQEIELAKTEMLEKGKAAGGAAAMFGGAAIAGALTLGSLTAFLIILLALVLPAWASALLVTLLWAAVASVLAFLGRSRAAEIGKPMPEKTVETVKEDVQWLTNRS
jgi:Putative Actinobacterial Holin-X, holin superfamily III